MCCGTEAGSYLRLIDSCITQIKAQGPSRTCSESKEEEAKTLAARCEGPFFNPLRVRLLSHATRIARCIRKYRASLLLYYSKGVLIGF